MCPVHHRRRSSTVLLVCMLVLVLVIPSGAKGGKGTPKPKKQESVKVVLQKHTSNSQKRPIFVVNTTAPITELPKQVQDDLTNHGWPKDKNGTELDGLTVCDVGGVIDPFNAPWQKKVIADDCCTQSRKIKSFGFEGSLSIRHYAKNGKDTPKLGEHEQGHGEICKKVWNVHAADVAKKAAEACNLIGRVIWDKQCIPKDAPTIEEACKKAKKNVNAKIAGSPGPPPVPSLIDECTKDIINALKDMLKVPSDEYDEETDHGRNDKPTKGAVAKAVANAKKRHNPGKGKKYARKE